MQLNLIAERQEEKLIKQYLEENASDMLVKKINNGVNVEKDGKKLINKKTLSGFMKYACDKAKEQAPKGATGTFIAKETVYGWAVHYFEEDGIEETLLNLDGTEYKKIVSKPIISIKKPVTTSSPKPKEIQGSLFDVVEEEEKETVEEITVTETKENKKGSIVYQQYTELQDKYPDCIVAYRLGDFYEVFGEKAKKVAEEIDLTLTGRDCGLPERVPMVGYPYHMSDIYVKKLMDKGFKVVVAESMTDIRVLPETKIEIDNDTGEIFNDITTEKERYSETLFSLFDYKMEVLL